MQNKKIIPKLEKVRTDSFVGLRVENNNLIFSYPITYRLNKDNEKELYSQIKKLLRTISLTTQSKEFNSLYKDKDELALKSEVPLLAYLYIISDYIINGKYRNLEKIIKKENKGKINWKKTLKQVPYISNGSFIYPNFYTEHNSQYDSVIVDIYKHCLKIAINTLGWLFSIEEDEYIKNTIYEYDKDFFLQVIRKELSQTYNDKKRHRLITMKEIILGINLDSNKDYKVFGIDKYWPVFEYMLREMFENIKKEDYKELYPNTEWYINEKPTNDQKSLRPDIIYENKGKYYIVIDAKYYPYGHTLNPSDLPGSADIFKQFVYSDNINLVTQGKPVYNCFIMPFNKEQKEHNIDTNYKCIGYATSSNKEDEIILGILIDLTYLIENYSKRFSKEDAEVLSNIIFEKTKNFTNTI